MSETQIFVPKVRLALNAAEYPSIIGDEASAVAYSYGETSTEEANNSYTITQASGDFNQFQLAGLNPDPAVLFVAVLTRAEFGVLDGLSAKVYRLSQASGAIVPTLNSGVVLGTLSTAPSVIEDLLWSSSTDKVSGAAQNLKGDKRFTDYRYVVVYYANSSTVNRISWTRNSIQVAPLMSGGFNQPTITALGVRSFQYTTGTGSVLTDSSAVEIYGV